jgi:hypothetical protein
MDERDYERAIFRLILENNGLKKKNPVKLPQKSIHFLEWVGVGGIGYRIINFMFCRF